MKAFYILKPDAITRPEVLEHYQETINNQKYIENRNQYYVESWIDLSCQLYEPHSKDISLEALLTLRRQMLTTIKGYEYLYPNTPAIIDIFDVPNTEETFCQLEKIKYQIRKKYVLNTPKNYFHFKELSDKILTQKLEDIPIEQLEVEHIKVNFDEEITLPNYYMAYLNCIHFPDPNVDSIERDLEIISASKTLTKKIKL